MNSKKLNYMTKLPKEIEEKIRKKIQKLGEVIIIIEEEIEKYKEQYDNKKIEKIIKDELEKIDD